MQSGSKNGLEYAIDSNVGMRRATNQDSLVHILAANDDEWRRQGHFFMVADGMGAHAAGELASKLAVDGVPHLYRKHLDASPPEALRKAVEETNTEINRRGKANLDFHNMGTTASALVLLPQGAIAAHVGDSRVYRLRGAVLEQLTFDHSLVWELQKARQITEEAALAGNIPKNVITRSLGPNELVEVDIEGPFPIQAGDTFMLCSDGLTGQVEDDEIGAILGNLDPEEAVQVLIDLANLRGGPDNISLIVARVAAPEMATLAAGAEPLRLGPRKPPRKAPIFLWVAAGLLMMLALIFLLSSRLDVAAINAVASVVCVLLAVILRFAQSEGGASLGGGQHLGEGPHRSVNCPVDARAVSRLSTITDELRQAAEEEGWTVDWTKFDGHIKKASSTDDPRQSFREFARAIMFMMHELRRNSHSGGASDSSIEL